MAKIDGTICVRILTCGGGSMPPGSATVLLGILLGITNARKNKGLRLLVTPCFYW